MKTIKTTTTENGITTDENTMTLYTYDELNDTAKERALEGFLKEYEPWAGDDFEQFAEYEVWAAVRDLENALSATGAQWQYNRAYSSGFNVEWRYSDDLPPNDVDAVKDNGNCYSMDICDAWNSHVARLNSIGAWIDDLNGLWRDNLKDISLAARFDDMSLSAIDRWYLEFENALQDVANTIERILENEYAYYTSAEYLRIRFADEVEQGGELYTMSRSGLKWYHDSRRWYTANGDLYEQANVCRVVSLMKIR